MMRTFSSNLPGQFLAVFAMAAVLLLGTMDMAQAQDAPPDFSDTGSVNFDDSEKISDWLVFGGFDIREDTYYPYAGFIHYFDGDVVTDGFLFRGFGLYADYEYTTAAVPGGVVNADAYAVDAMVGYQKVLPDISLRGYVGVEYVDHDLSPNNVLDSNRGGDFGAKFQAEIETNYASQIYASAIASYGTAKDGHWGRLRAGYDFSGYVVGPEASFAGDNQWAEQRVGGFVLVKNLDPVYLSANAGYSNTSNRRGDGSGYFGFELAKYF